MPETLNPETTLVVGFDQLDEEIDKFLRQGYRIEMIIPSDAPREVLLSGHGECIRLKSQNRQRSNDVEWAFGRAGMEYRDLIPGRLGGRLIASHIRISSGGELPDYVHYHKVAYQMIYCWHGRVRVVYEDQGDPFWLHPGDCVLQPPEMRHRVLESAAGTEVIEMTSPAVHETWADHEMILPTGRLLPDRDFGGQRFVHHKAADSIPVLDEFGGFESHHFGIAAATNGALHVFELRVRGDHSTYASAGSDEHNTFLFLLTGRLNLAAASLGEHRFTPGDSILIPPRTRYDLSATANSEILRVDI